jgi:hypothetical protein
MQAGVEQIKQKFAQEDAAWAPHESVLRQFSKSRADTITQLMSWWNALAANPREAFPALLQSFKLTPEQIFGGGQQQQQQYTQQQQAAIANLSPVEQAIVPYLQHFQQEIGGLKQTFQQQRDQDGAARANAVIEEFKKGKPHFDRCRAQMAAVIQSGLVPLTPNGSVDLQSAYDFVVRADPELHEQMIAQRIAAERKAAKEQASRARYASSSLAPTSPGAPDRCCRPGRSRHRRRPSSPPIGRAQRT